MAEADQNGQIVIEILSEKKKKKKLFKKERKGDKGGSANLREKKRCSNKQTEKRHICGCFGTDTYAGAFLLY